MMPFAVGKTVDYRTERHVPQTKDNFSEYFQILYLKNNRNTDFVLTAHPDISPCIMNLLASIDF